MSRTVHHLPVAHARPRLPDTPAGRPYIEPQLFDLRYSHAVMRRAAVEGCRPEPQKLHRRSPIYDFARLSRHSRTISVLASIDESRLRQALRHRCRLAVALHRAGTDLAEFGFDIAPGRHRRNAVWQSW